MKLTPPIPLTDPRFIYTPSHSTDIRARFDAVRKSIANRTEPNVIPITKEQRK